MLLLLSQAELLGNQTYINISPCGSKKILLGICSVLALSRHWVSIYADQILSCGDYILVGGTYRSNQTNGYLYIMKIKEHCLMGWGHYFGKSIHSCISYFTFGISKQKTHLTVT